MGRIRVRPSRDRAGGRARRHELRHRSGRRDGRGSPRDRRRRPRGARGLEAQPRRVRREHGDQHRSAPGGGRGRGPPTARRGRDRRGRGPGPPARYAVRGRELRIAGGARRRRRAVRRPEHRRDRARAAPEPVHAVGRPLAAADDRRRRRRDLDAEDEDPSLGRRDALAEELLRVRAGPGLRLAEERAALGGARAVDPGCRRRRPSRLRDRGRHRRHGGERSDPGDADRGERPRLRRRSRGDRRGQRAGDGVRPREDRVPGGGGAVPRSGGHGQDPRGRRGHRRRSPRTSRRFRSSTR